MLYTGTYKTRVHPTKKIRFVEWIALSTLAYTYETLGLRSAGS
jgi:hypothetical protein